MAASNGVPADLILFIQILAIEPPFVVVGTTRRCRRLRPWVPASNPNRNLNGNIKRSPSSYILIFWYYQRPLSTIRPLFSHFHFLLAFCFYLWSNQRSPQSGRSYVYLYLYEFYNTVAIGRFKCYHMASDLLALCSMYPATPVGLHRNTQRFPSIFIAFTASFYAQLLFQFPTNLFNYV